MTQLSEQEKQLAALICRGCSTPADLTAKLKALFAGALEKMLEAEMDEHLGYEKHSSKGDNSGNSRNGYSRKTIKSEWGESEISVPRDRSGTFQFSVYCLCPSFLNRALGLSAKTAVSLHPTCLPS